MQCRFKSPLQKCATVRSAAPAKFAFSVKSELDVYWELRHLRGSLAARTARRTLVFIEFDRLGSFCPQCADRIDRCGTDRGVNAAMVMQSLSVK
jgi:hypothetical protein